MTCKSTLGLSTCEDSNRGSRSPHLCPKAPDSRNPPRPHWVSRATSESQVEALMVGLNTRAPVQRPPSPPQVTPIFSFSQQVTSGHHTPSRHPAGPVAPSGVGGQREPAGLGDSGLTWALPVSVQWVRERQCPAKPQGPPCTILARSASHPGPPSPGPARPLIPSGAISRVRVRHCGQGEAGQDRG